MSVKTDAKEHFADAYSKRTRVLTYTLVHACR